LNIFKIEMDVSVVTQPVAVIVKRKDQCHGRLANCAVNLVATVASVACDKLLFITATQSSVARILEPFSSSSNFCSPLASKDLLVSGVTTSEFQNPFTSDETIVRRGYQA